MHNKVEWIETLTHTVDYGDKTCKENKNGNPWKETFIEILHVWKSTSRQHNIIYFLAYGSLIGAVRNADFIPWDSDIDIMVHKDDSDVIASLDNKRNFVVDRNDPAFHLVVQNDFKQYYDDADKRRRLNCLGQVKYINIFTK